MIVYLILNQANLKGYVGQHKGNTISTRWTPRLNLSKVNRHLRHAIEKYGQGVFTREILNYCSSREETDRLEKLWIATLRTYDARYGYNKHFGGRFCRGHTQSARERISQAMKRVWKWRSRQAHAEAVRNWWASRTDAERRKICHKMSLKRRGQSIPKKSPPWNKGVFGLPSTKRGKKYGPQKNPCLSYPPRTEEHKRKISEARKRYWAWKRQASRRDSVTTVKYQPREINPENRKPPRFTGGFKGGPKLGCCL